MRFVSLSIALTATLALISTASSIAVSNEQTHTSPDFSRTNNKDDSRPSLSKHQQQQQGHFSPASAAAVAAAGTVADIPLSEQDRRHDPRQSPRRPPRVNVTTWFESYHRSDAIRDYFLQLKDDYPCLVTFVPNLARTHEGREVYAVKISAKGKGGGRHDDKPQIWIQALQHAREWATVQWIAHHFTSQYSTSSLVTTLLQSSELILIPNMNPDGYEYSWDHDRIWRKNRRPNGNNIYGVDLNRNWPDSFWGNGGSSTSPDAEDYGGPYANSEPEVQGLVKYFMAQQQQRRGRQNKILGAVDLHTHAQLILRPHGRTNATTPHEQEMKLVGDTMAKVIKDRHGMEYISKRLYEVSPQLTTGSSIDWFYGDMATKSNGGQRVYSYAFELRPDPSGSDQENGKIGFILPVEQIVPLGEEIAAAMEYFIDHVIKNPLK
ncbi:hypothetical protein BG004_004543 [Podila humilis]|nr:hypothetical protein BG004_004543 [Podila humilis]